VRPRRRNRCCHDHEGLDKSAHTFHVEAGGHKREPTADFWTSVV